MSCNLSFSSDRCVVLRRMRSAVFCALLFVLLATPFAFGIGCLDENGQPVDWWVIMKAPVLPDSSDPTAQSGFGYAYLDANSPVLQWTGKQLNTNLNGALGGTLASIYNADSSSVAWVMYNDEPPSGRASDTYGHTKGDLAFDSNGGFWLVHSVPRFPVATGNTYTYPDDEKDYGQSFLCVTYDVSTFNNIADAFLLNKPYVYDSNLPSSLAQQVPDMQMVINKQWDSKESLSNATSVRSSGGKPFMVFSKNTKWDSNLYSDLIEPTFNVGLYVESWMDGADSNKMPTFCAGSQYKYSTINVREVTIGSVTWPETKDHSKWAVSLSKTYTCIGDINRQFSQAKRGGGSVCFNDGNVYKSIYGMITKADSC